MSNHSTLRRRACRAALVATVALAAFPALAGAAPGTAADPDDVDLRVDLKTLSHDNDASSITLTAQAYARFPDEWADFKWGIDKNGDESFDVFVFTEFEDGALVAGVDDANEDPLAEAKVSRPAPDTIAVTFPTRLLGKVTSYRYGALAATDLNGNGEEDAGETDVAPNSGLYTHDLGGAAPAKSATPVAAPAAQSAPAAEPSAPKASPKAAQPTAAPAPAPSAAKTEPPAAATKSPAPETKAPAPVASVKPAPGRATATVIAPAPKAPAPAPAPARAPAPAVTETKAAAEAATPAALARTGAMHDVLVVLGGLAFLVGGMAMILESLVPGHISRARQSR